MHFCTSHTLKMWHDLFCSDASCRFVFRTQSSRFAYKENGKFRIPFSIEPEFCFVSKFSLGCFFFSIISVRKVILAVYQTVIISLVKFFSWNQ